MAAATASKPRSISVRAARVVRAVEIVSVDLIAVDVVPVDVVDVDVVSAHNRVPIQIGAVTADVAVHDRAIDVNVPVAVVDVEVAIDVHINERSIDSNPASTDPAVVIDPSPAPIPVVVKPRANRQAGANRQGIRSARRIHDRLRRFKGNGQPQRRVQEIRRKGERRRRQDRFLRNKDRHGFHLGRQ